MKQKPIEDRFHNARNDQSLVVIEGFHPLKHAIRFGADLIEIVSPDLDGLKALQDEYAPDIESKISEYVNWVSNDVFNLLGPSRPPTSVMAIAKRPIVELAKMLNDPNPAPVVLLENPRNLFNIGAAVRAAAAPAEELHDARLARQRRRRQRLHQERHGQRPYRKRRLPRRPRCLNWIYS